MGRPALTVDGVDIEDALLRIQDLELLEELLVELTATWADGAKRIERTWRAGQREKAGDVAHALAGVAGTLSVVDVRASARLLETMLRSDTDEGIEEELARLEGALVALVAAVDRAQKR